MSTPVASESQIQSAARTIEQKPGGPEGAGVAAPRSAAAQPAVGGLAPAGAKAWALERWLVRRVLRAAGEIPVSFVLWDGQEIRASAAPPVARLLVRDRRALVRMFCDLDLYFGEAYGDGRLAVDGDLVKLLEVFHHARVARGARSGLLRRGVARWRRWKQSNTLRGAQANIHHHYDIGNDFYRLWLDEELVYTCAYFPTPDCTLAEAQRAKMELVCRKLWLRPGETVVEAGCGWGALALHMARHYGVCVKAYNISHEQIAHASQRAKAEGLQSRVEFIEDDYRNISGRFDVFVSVGMLEHVGLDHYHELGAVIDRCLPDFGRGLIHSIGQNDPPSELNPWIQRRIFPGSYPPSLKQMLRVLAPGGFSVLDVENLRLHYARTLRHWLGRFEAAAPAVAQMFDERFVRMWRLYLASSMTAFAAGALQLFQIVFTRPTVHEIPWTRGGLGEAATGNPSFG